MHNFGRASKDVAFTTVHAGMQGLIPRATELAKLGGSFWVSFYPFIGAIIAAFIVLYLVSKRGRGACLIIAMSLTLDVQYSLHL